MTPTTTHPDMLAEGARVADWAASEQLDLPLIGGVAIALRCPSHAEPPLRRAYADIDVAGRASDRKRIVDLMGRIGYVPDESFNALHGAKRLYFWDPVHSRQLDVFLDTFEMCHKIDLEPRIGIGGATLPLADLLLMKLQVMETNDKDIRDAITLLVDQPFTDDDEGINLPYIAGLTAADWGLWRTITLVAERVDAYARTLEGFERAGEVHAQVQRLLEACEAAPKKRSWKLRARVGDRVRWYALPEEEAH